MTYILLWYFYLGLATLSFLILVAIDSAHLFSRKEVRPSASKGSYNPKTLVIVPCKGKDVTLHENLRSLSAQRYGNYDIVAVVDSGHDEALDAIKNIGIKHIISDSKCSRCSGKVRAIGTAVEKLGNYEVYVIVDSDVLVDERWLEALIRPLDDKNTGLSTMYPYFKPIGGFWSKVKMMWGFVGDSMLERESSRFGWGGSLAFRRDLMDAKSMDFFKGSEYSVSDDICLTKIAKSKGLGIAYVPSPKPVVNCKENLGSFYEWANRQTTLTLLGYRKNLYVGLVYYSMESLVFISGILLSIFISPLFLLFFAHYLRNVILGYKRSGARYLEIPFIVLMLPFLYDINLIAAYGTKSITWRGRKYRIRG